VSVAGLPLLEVLLDAGAMTDLLSDGAGGVEVRGARLVDLQPAARALVALEVAGPGGRRVVVLAKHYAQGARAARLHALLVALRGEIVGRGLSFAVPRPLGWLPDLSIVLYLPAPGRLLDAFLTEAAAPSLVARSGRCLAELHSCRPPLDRSFDAAHEAANVDAWARAVERALPGSRAPALAHAFTRGVERIALSAQAPVHKDFHPRHVVVGERMGVIDLDEMRWGDPAFDLAHFCAYVELMGLRQRLSSAARARLQRLFRHGYARLPPSDERLPLFGVYACVKIARQLVAARGPGPVPTGAEQRRQLRRMLAYGHNLAAGLP
jgi:hypothetical protein